MMMLLNGRGPLLDIVVLIMNSSKKLRQKNSLSVLNEIFLVCVTVLSHTTQVLHSHIEITRALKLVECMASPETLLKVLQPEFIIERRYRIFCLQVRMSIAMVYWVS